MVNVSITPSPLPTYCHVPEETSWPLAREMVSPPCRITVPLLENEPLTVKDLPLSVRVVFVCSVMLFIVRPISRTGSFVTSGMEILSALPGTVPIFQLVAVPQSVSVVPVQTKTLDVKSHPALFSRFVDEVG